MVGIDPASDGLQRAREMGIKTTAGGVDGLLPHVEADDIRIAFDATSRLRARRELAASSTSSAWSDDRPHAGGHRPVLRAAGQPARTSCASARDERQHGHLRRPGHDPDGGRRVPGAAGGLRRDRRHRGQSSSAGPGTRRNIDEFTRTTAGAVEKIGGADSGQGDHHPQPRRAAADHARHHPLPDRGRARPRRPSPRSVHGHDRRGAAVRARLHADERAGVRRQRACRSSSRSKASATTCPKYAGNLDIMTAAAAAARRRCSPRRCSAGGTSCNCAVPLQH